MDSLQAILTIDGDSENPSHEMYIKLQQAKKMAAMGIFATGAILHYMKEYDLWQGYADSWNEFCASEAHSYSFAHTAMRLYRKYVLELRLPEDTIDALMARDYTSLDAAAKVITEKNSEEWVGKLLTLSRQDITKEIRVTQGKDEIQQTEIDKVVILFFSLTYEEQQEALQRINERRQG